jgi:hypothetical protein
VGRHRGRNRHLGTYRDTKGYGPRGFYVADGALPEPYTYGPAGAGTATDERAACLPSAAVTSFATRFAALSAVV